MVTTDFRAVFHAEWQTGVGDAMLSRRSQRDGITLHRPICMSHLRVIRMYKHFQSNLVIEIRRSVSSTKHDSLASTSQDKLRREYERVASLQIYRESSSSSSYRDNLCKCTNTLESTRSRARTFVHVASQHVEIFNSPVPYYMCWMSASNKVDIDSSMIIYSRGMSDLIQLRFRWHFPFFKFTFSFIWSVRSFSLETMNKLAPNDRKITACLRA